MLGASLLDEPKRVLVESQLEPQVEILDLLDQSLQSKGRVRAHWRREFADLDPRESNEFSRPGLVSLELGERGSPGRGMIAPEGPRALGSPG